MRFGIIKRFIYNLFFSLPGIIWCFLNLLYKARKNRPVPLEGPFLIIVTNGIGDTVITLPAIKTIRNHFPKAQIDCLSQPYVAPLLRQLDYIDNVATMYKAPFPSLLKIIHNIVELYKLRKRKYNTIIDLASNFYTAWRGFLIGARKRCGLSREEKIGLMTINDFGFLYTDDHKGITAHTYPEACLNFIKAMGLIPLAKNTIPTLKFHSTESKYIDKKNISQKIIVIQPSGLQYIKLWPAEKYIKLINKLLEHRDLYIIVVDNAMDRYWLAKRPLRFIKQISVLNDLKLDEYIALIHQADLFIGNDSGPMHIAYAVGTKAVAIFGPTSPEEILPSGTSVKAIYNKIECSPCYYSIGVYDRCYLGHHKCMEGSDVETVYNAVIESLH